MRLESLVDKFDIEPYAPAATIGAGLVFTGEDAMHALHSGMYLADFVPLLDLFVSNLEAYGTVHEFDLGEMLGFPTGLAPTLFDLYAAFIPIVYADWADGMVLAITCSGSARVAEEVTLDQVRSEYGVYGIPRIDFPEVPQVCDGLGIQLDPWWTYRVRRTRVPTLIRHGSLDHAVPPDWSVRLAQKLGPRSQHLEFEYAGHALPVTVPVDTLVQFIDQPYRPVG
jgi:pimeloyl-ACP methyl ester carboxylesterase